MRSAGRLVGCVVVTDFPLFDGPSTAAAEVDDAKPKGPRERIGINEAAAQGRCVCEGCPACRGKAGYPCATLVNLPEIRPDGLCRHCRRAQRRATR